MFPTIKGKRRWMRKPKSAREVELKAKIFISYSRREMAFADRLEAALKPRGFAPLIDRTEIRASVRSPSPIQLHA
jgi:hypothetical protein